jgi:hypothetical protein
MVNVIGAVYLKSGVLNRTFDLHPFFNVTSSDYIGDPKVLFDAPSGRWFASVFDQGHRALT